MSEVDNGNEDIYWAAYHPDRNTYSVPQDIIAVIGGDGKGNAQIKTPGNGSFDYADLQTLFRRTVTPTVRTPTRTAPALASVTAARAAGAFSDAGKRAAILVPVIAGAALLTALAAWLILRHRRRSKLGGLEGYKEHNASIMPESLPSPDWDRHPPTGYSARAYSDYTGLPAPSLAELPLEQTPSGTPRPPREYVSWAAPREARDDGVLPGHYPPPLPDEYVELNSPEMKERPRDGQGW